MAFRPPNLLFFMAVIALMTSAATPLSAVISETERTFFENKIRPVLAAECYECHGATKQKAGLRLDHRAGLLEGGDNGASVVAGDPTKSLLIQSIKHAHDDLKMPKNGAKLDARIIADFEKWISMGAPDPRDHAPTAEESAKDMDWKTVLKLRQQWWCFQPVNDSKPPAVKNTAWSQHPVDRFVLKKLEEANLQPAKRADSAAIIRRISYVLTGLPPTPEEVAAFEVASSSNPQTASAALIDRLLKSPRFGETWARHWMDWVRYAETYGSEGDPIIPYAWRYRDYLIRAFNQDVPYPQMVREAIAGDLLPHPRINQELAINESALGTAQLRMVLHGFSPVDTLDEKVTFTDNQIDVVTKAFQGLTVTCARCHNHKFDAISQADYYALFGIFNSTHPAVIDVGTKDKDKVIRSQMLKLKSEIKAALGKAWLKAAESLPEIKAKPQETKELVTYRKWDLRKDAWFADGEGVKQGATKPGEFSLMSHGDSVISYLHSGGVFTDLISTKDRGVLMSPRFKCEGGTLWMRSVGASGARVRYIVENYPRTGTIHKAKELKDDGDAIPGWRKLDLEFWKGDEIFIQATTVADMAAETKLDERSWFGITDALATTSSEVPTNPIASGSPLAAVKAWLSKTMTDEQAELLDALNREGKLPNKTTELAEVAPLLAMYRELDEALPIPIRAPGVLEADGLDQALFVRGNHKEPSEIVPRRFLEALNDKPYKPKDSGRLQLAESLVAKNNPLTSRVMANRIWHHVFGRGLVATTDNFGRLGTEPTHPELLDYLATKFYESGGSIKAMLRLLLTSETFQLDHQGSAEAAEHDPENFLLSHFSVRRLEAEAIRDSILSLSGKLSDQMFGESIGSKETRRSVYVKVLRNNLDPFLGVFDAPVPSSTRGRRDATNVPAQSLAMLNDPAVLDWSTQWALRVLKNQNQSNEERVQRMFLEAYGRKATTEEQSQSLAYINSLLNSNSGAQQEIVTLEQQAAALRETISKTIETARSSLGSSKPLTKITAPVPFAEWDFEEGAKDLRGALHLELKGEARIAGGALVLGGYKSYAESPPLMKTLREKTLEAWVQLDDLDQRGAGVMTVQTLNGSVFDSIVFAEKDPQAWLSGSNFFKRTQSFEGDPEKAANLKPVHVAIVYRADGTVICYRKGKPYGHSYLSTEVASFEPEKSNIVFGMRHAPAGGNKMLHGRLLRARLYDRALSDDEVNASSKVEALGPSDEEVLASLSAVDREAVISSRGKLEILNTKLTDLRSALSDVGPEAAWKSLAQSLINLKEFIYLR
jgi:cytochrome c553